MALLIVIPVNYEHTFACFWADHSQHSDRCSSAAPHRNIQMCVDRCHNSAATHVPHLAIISELLAASDKQLTSLRIDYVTKSAHIKTMSIDTDVFGP